jgi:quinol-cytochrome oxidoreductase complex cytochrome b subunit
MTEKNASPEKDSVPFYPDHVRTEVKVVIGLLAVVVIVGVLGLLMPVGLEDPADPMNTPPHVKAHWYFLFLQQMLKYVPKDIGVVIPVVALAALAIWPFFDRRADTLRARKVRIVGSATAMVAIGILTVLGAMG